MRGQFHGSLGPHTESFPAVPSTPWPVEGGVFCLFHVAQSSNWAGTRYLGSCFVLKIRSLEQRGSTRGGQEAGRTGLPALEQEAAGRQPQDGRGISRPGSSLLSPGWERACRGLSGAACPSLLLSVVLVLLLMLSPQCHLRGPRHGPHTWNTRARAGLPWGHWRVNRLEARACIPKLAARSAGPGWEKPQGSPGQLSCPRWRAGKAIWSGDCARAAATSGSSVRLSCWMGEPLQLRLSAEY